MIILAATPIRIRRMTPLNLAILKSLIPEFESKCLDLSLKYQAEWVGLLKQKMEFAIKNENESIDLSNYIESTAEGHSFWKFPLKNFLPVWFIRDYGLTLLKKKEMDEIDEKIMNYFKKIVDDIKSYEPKIVGFTTDYDTLGFVLNLAKILKEVGVKIILGGPGVRYCGKYLVREFKFLDAVVVGEAEMVFNKVIKMMLRNNLKKKLIVPKQPVIMDKIPFPNYDDFNLKKYYMIGLETQRGCVNRCAFCCNRMTHNWEIYREKSIERVREEISFLKKYGDIFFFADNITNPYSKRLKDLCKAIKDLDIYWESSFIPTITKEEALLMKESGCFRAWLGCESLSNRVLKLMNKKTTVSSILKTIRNLHNVGIRTHTMFFFGFPGETIWDVILTIKRILQNLEYITSIGIGWFDCVYNCLVHRNPQEWNVILIPNKERWSVYHSLVPFHYSDYFRNTIKIPLIAFFQEFLARRGKEEYITFEGETRQSVRP